MSGVASVAVLIQTLLSINILRLDVFAIKMQNISFATTEMILVNSNVSLVTFLLSSIFRLPSVCSLVCHSHISFGRIFSDFAHDVALSTIQQ